MDFCSVPGINFTSCFYNHNHLYICVVRQTDTYHEYDELITLIRRGSEFLVRMSVFIVPSLPRKERKSKELYLHKKLQFGKPYIIKRLLEVFKSREAYMPMPRDFFCRNWEEYYRVSVSVICKSCLKCEHHVCLSELQTTSTIHLFNSEWSDHIRKTNSAHYAL